MFVGKASDVKHLTFSEFLKNLGIGFRFAGSVRVTPRRLPGVGATGDGAGTPGKCNCTVIAMSSKSPVARLAAGGQHRPDAFQPIASRFATRAAWPATAHPTAICTGPVANPVISLAGSTVARPPLRPGFPAGRHCRCRPRSARRRGGLASRTTAPGARSSAATRADCPGLRRVASTRPVCQHATCLPGEWRHAEPGNCSSAARWKCRSSANPNSTTDLRCQATP